MSDEKQRYFGQILPIVIFKEKNIISHNSDFLSFLYLVLSESILIQSEHLSSGMGTFGIKIDNSTFTTVQPWKYGVDYWSSFELYPEWTGKNFYVFKVHSNL